MGLAGTHEAPSLNSSSQLVRLGHEIPISNFLLIPVNAPSASCVCRFVVSVLNWDSRMPPSVVDTAHMLVSVGGRKSWGTLVMIYRRLLAPLDTVAIHESASIVFVMTGSSYGPRTFRKKPGTLRSKNKAQAPNTQHQAPNLS